MPVTLMRHAPRIGNVLLNTAAVVALGVSTSSIWASGTITTPSGSSIAGVGGDVEWSLTEFSVGNGAAKEKWRDVFTYFDEGTNSCNRLFVSGGGVAGSTQSPAVPVSIDSCTTAKGVFDQVDTAQRLVFLALALAGFGVLTMLSVAALSSQENGSDLWLPGLYSVVATVLGFTLAVSAVSVFQTAVTAATGDSDEVWVTLAVFFAGNSAGATSLDGNDISGSTVALDTQGGFAAGAIAAAFLAVSSLLSVYELWMIKREADAEEAEKERQAQALKDKKADLAAKNRAAAEAQAQRVSELQAGSSGAAAEGKKDA